MFSEFDDFVSCYTLLFKSNHDWWCTVTVPVESGTFNPEGLKSGGLWRIGQSLEIQQITEGSVSLEILGQHYRTPNVGLEPTTLRLRVSCSTDWASQAFICILCIKLANPSRQRGQREWSFSLVPLNKGALQYRVRIGQNEMWDASTGNRTRAARVAGEHSTTEPSMLVTVSREYNKNLLK